MPPTVQINVGGQTVIIPGVYVSTSVTPVVPSGLLPTGPLVFVAFSYGGVPFTPINFTSAQGLQTAMRGAPSSDLVPFMFNPSSELNGTSFVTLINVGLNAQSSATIVSSGNTGVITMTSADYGTPSNEITYSISLGSIISGNTNTTAPITFPVSTIPVVSTIGFENSGVLLVGGVQCSYTNISPTSFNGVSGGTGTVNSGSTVQQLSGINMTLTDGFSGNSFTGYNLGTPFQIAYLGTSNSVTYTISSSITGKATQLQITSPNAGESVTINLTSQTYATMAQVVEEIEGTGFYTCNMIGNGVLPSYYFDVVSNVALPKPISNVDQYVNVTAALGDVVYWINSVANNYVTAVIPGSITSSPGLAPAPIALAYFTGANNQVPSLGNYASGFNVALTVPAWVVMADTQSLGVQALGAQHAATASTVAYQEWRRFVTGSQLNETPATASTNAHNLNEFFCTYCWPGIQATNVVTGLNQTYDGLHTAAAVAGIMTGNPVATPLTNKTLLGNGVEQLASLANIITMQDSGVLVLNYPSSTKIPTFLSDVTTWQNDSNPANVFNQQVACRFALSYYLTTQLQPYVGTIASNFNEANILNATKVALNSIIFNGQNSSGILNAWDTSSLTISYDGSTQAATVSVSVVFVGQNRFIIVNVTVNPLNINISSAGVVTNG